MSINIPYAKTGYFSKLICDYLQNKSSLQDFFGNFPQLENFEKQIATKQASFSTSHREILVRQLKEQYKDVAASQSTLDNFDSLISEKTFTITTGHQLNLFTGPLYFLYKIISVINISEALVKKHPGNHFVPIYWMATEDHDFDEINYFNFKGEKVKWDRPDGGAVGEKDTQGLDAVLASVIEAWGATDNANFLKDLFKKAYVEHSTLSAATRFLADALFAEYGLVIVDGNDASLKTLFAPFVVNELENKTSFKEITATTAQLIEAGYGEQVHPREINLFYLNGDVRERIIEKDSVFYINETKLSFTKTEILKEVETHPERFSPNALLRPLYQEVILPNLCYIGGGGELAYWFQLKDYFETVDVPFPMLLLRNSALLINGKQQKKLDSLDVSVTDLFMNQKVLLSSYTKKISDIKIDFSKQKKHLQQQFEALYILANKTDKSFIGAVAAQEKKQLNGLDHLEKRLLKAQKRKLKSTLAKLKDLQDDLFPKQSLQERTVNFSELYIEHGDQLIYILKKELDVTDFNFKVIKL